VDVVENDTMHSFAASGCGRVLTAAWLLSWKSPCHLAGSIAGPAAFLIRSRDIDILFLHPAPVYWQYQGRTGNHQSQLLQEVKDVLLKTYSQTAMRADEQVIRVPFNSIPVEVSIGFICTDGSIIVCHTNNGGFYKTSTAQAEAADLDISDRLLWNGNTRALVRIMKCWQRFCNVGNIINAMCSIMTGW
jgi:hypothetical protein